MTAPSALRWESQIPSSPQKFKVGPIFTVKGELSQSSEYHQMEHFEEKDRVAPLIADPPPANSNTMQSRLLRKDRNVCFGSTAELPGQA